MKYIIIFMLFLVGCVPAETTTETEVEKVYINIDRQQIELVSDEYGNQYLKQYTYMNKVVYIPFTFETAEEEDTTSVQSLYTKNESTSIKRGKRAWTR